jgi:hypothetical protein
VLSEAFSSVSTIFTILSAALFSDLLFQICLSFVLSFLLFPPMPKPEKIQFGIAEVVGSTPTRSISSIPVNYGIELSSFLMIVGQPNSQLNHQATTPPVNKC